MDNRLGATELRVFVYDIIAKRGRPPASTEIGAHFGITPDDARLAVADARLGKDLFPDPHTGEIAIAGPIAGTPTPHRVTANGVTWFAVSGWDLLGVAAMFGTDVSIEIRCADCGDPIKMVLEPYSFPSFRFPKTAPADQNIVVHFMLPARQWQDDVSVTCGTMTIFTNEAHLDRWLASRKQARGAVVGLEQAWRLALAWYHDPRSPSWRPTTKAEQQGMLESVGLRGAFWRLS